MGPSLTTEEIKTWGPANGLSKACTEQILAVSEERDALQRKVEELEGQLKDTEKLLEILRERR